MSIFSRELKRGMKELRKAQGKPVFTWDGEDYECVNNTASASKSLGEGGFAFESDLTLFVRIAVLPDPGPKEKETLISEGKTYRIDKISRLPGDELLRFDCNDPNRNI